MGFVQPLSFTPIYQQRVWGGRALAGTLGRRIPDGVPIGESWDLVDRPDAQSVVDTGSCAGMTLHQLWTEHRADVFGDNLPESERFPMLFKILDASALLSLQVHPPEKQVAEFGGESKTEAWVFLEAKPEAEVYVGFRNGVTRAEFESTLTTGRIEPLLHRLQVKAGDTIFVPSGRCHAIGAGCLIAEVQQNSDTTYRAFDWNRVGLDGKPRDLHQAESLACINFDDHEPGLTLPDGESVVSCPFFRVARWQLEAPRLDLEGAAFFLVTQGAVECGGRTFQRGTTFLLPKEARTLPLSPLFPDTELLRATLR